MNDHTEIDQLVRAAASSLAITWGTGAPFAIGKIRAERVGFASLPSVVLDVYCRAEDLGSVIPIIRQRVYGELAERGWRPEDVSVVPMVGAGRTRKYRDENERSDSCGRNKMGVQHNVRFDMSRELAAATFQGFGSFKSIPDRSAS